MDPVSQILTELEAAWWLLWSVPAIPMAEDRGGQAWQLVAGTVTVLVLRGWPSDHVADLAAVTWAGGGRLEEQRRHVPHARSHWGSHGRVQLVTHTGHHAGCRHAPISCYMFTRTAPIHGELWAGPFTKTPGSRVRILTSSRVRGVRIEIRQIIEFS